ncbi:frem3 [Cordylochernes scorpioides]|uniref:Frem3 n=1 Tax=Cordylochernes scorpioides TaxID=51811 RepID=A0ABY6K165_9ARAC|nr:frem3 [Cordylochernes scorpioides]
MTTGKIKVSRDGNRTHNVPLTGQMPCPLGYSGREVEKTCEVAILDDPIYEGEERFRLVLGSPQGDALVGPVNVTAVWIDDPEDRPVIKFNVSRVDVREPRRPNTFSRVAVAVVRSGDLSRSSAVRVHTKDGSAKAGKDYIPISKELLFLPNRTSVLVHLQIFYDTDMEYREAFSLHLRPDRHFLARLEVPKVVIFIEDADSPAHVTFPTVPLVVSLKDYDHPEEAATSPTPGYPLICITITAIDTHGVDIQELQDKNNKSKYSGDQIQNMERIVSFVIQEDHADKIIKYYEDFNLLSDRQHGFRRSKSTITALTEIIKIVLEHKIREYAVIIAVDISAAFDNAWWPALMKRLDEDGGQASMIKLLQSYFDNRRIRFRYSSTEINKKLSKGCPQGGPLSPTLWNILINEILNNNLDDNCETIGYADDITLICWNKTPEQLRKTIDNVLRKINKWCESQCSILVDFGHQGLVQCWGRGLVQEGRYVLGLIRPVIRRVGAVAGHFSITGSRSKLNED